MRSLGRPGASVVLAILLSMGGTAAAQRRAVIVRDATGAPTCKDLVACPGGICDGELVCEAPTAGFGSHCYPEDGRAMAATYCCDRDEDCPLFVAVGGDLIRCAPVSFPDGATFGVCVHEIGRTWCADEVGSPEAGDVTDCITPPGASGGGPGNYDEGDCDRDGLANGSPDGLCPCAHGERCLDEPDAGTSADGGASMDSGSTRADAGTAEPMRPSRWRGAGGCQCALSGGHPRAAGGAGGLAAAWLLAVAAAIARRRGARTRALVPAAIAGWLLLPAPVLAQGPTRFQVLASGSYGCMVLDGCETAGDCPAPERCSTVADAETACLADPPTQEILCCASPEDCPVAADGTAAECVEVVARLRSEPTGFTVCRYPRFDTFCPHEAGEISDTDVEACLGASTTGGFAARWVDGNCDGDACPNGVDTAPCDPGSGCAMEADGGVGADSGVELDGGMNRIDGGLQRPDAGPPAGMDAGTRRGPPPAEVRYHGEGGCDCRAASGRRGRGDAWAFAVVAALAMVLAARAGSRSGRSRRHRA